MERALHFETNTIGDYVRPAAGGLLMVGGLASALYGASIYQRWDITPAIQSGLWFTGQPEAFIESMEWVLLGVVMNVLGGWVGGLFKK